MASEMSWKMKDILTKPDKHTGPTGFVKPLLKTITAKLNCSIPSIVSSISVLAEAVYEVIASFIKSLILILVNKERSYEPSDDNLNTAELIHFDTLETHSKMTNKNYPEESYVSDHLNISLNRAAFFSGDENMRTVVDVLLADLVNDMPPIIMPLSKFQVSMNIFN
ncbi:Hypothetical protein CINCED_3A006436 [Cinara cedri]|uniref:Uncharacterized protein n=1 Tax=Cinara cedri TaxID=506608 RepID=A0A5E4NNC9_9HEMI|nr:Hypothetical protein CINCED_3A006436 [Cinara cedri]